MAYSTSSNTPINGSADGFVSIYTF